ncbi:MAG: hypothetical protein ACREPL_00995, partial [Rhodanobacteraceae bacterium]
TTFSLVIPGLPREESCHSGAAAAPSRQNPESSFRSPRRRGDQKTFLSFRGCRSSIAAEPGIQIFLA